MQSVSSHPPPIPITVEPDVNKTAYVSEWIKNLTNFTRESNNNNNDNTNSEMEDCRDVKVDVKPVVNWRRNHGGETTSSTATGDTTTKRLTDPITKDDMKKLQSTTCDGRDGKGGGENGEKGGGGGGGNLVSSSTLTMQRCPFSVGQFSPSCTL